MRLLLSEELKAHCECAALSRRCVSDDVDEMAPVERDQAARKAEVVSMLISLINMIASGAVPDDKGGEETQFKYEITTIDHA